MTCDSKNACLGDGEVYRHGRAQRNREESGLGEMRGHLNIKTLRYIRRQQSQKSRGSKYQKRQKHRVRETRLWEICRGVQAILQDKGKDVRSDVGLGGADRSGRDLIIVLPRANSSGLRKSQNCFIRRSFDCSK
jgi:hypothetical protein